MSGLITNEDWARIDSIIGWMTEPEAQWLALMASTVCSWTEVGTNNGRSMLATGLGLRSHARLQVVDISMDPPQFWETCRYLKSRRPDLSIIIAECSSVDAAKWLLDTHVVFLDGDHTFDAVVTDIRTWRKKCVALCGHDYQHGKFPLGHQDVVDAVDQECTAIDIPVGTIWWERRQ